MSNITFSIWKPFVNNTDRGERWLQPMLSDFELLNTLELDKKNGLWHIEVEKNHRYVYLLIESGLSEPRDLTVTDMVTKERRENPRNKTEIEFLKQFFVLFDFDSNLLYFSDVRNKSYLEQILLRTTGKIFEIKGMYQDREEFLKLLTKVEEIQFSSKNDIFASLSDKREALSDLLDTKNFDDITLNLKMSGVKRQSVQPFIKKILHQSDNQQLSGIFIRGHDEEGFEHVFNRGTFIRKITIDSEKDELTGKFIGNNVKDKLLEEIEKLKK